MKRLTIIGRIATPAAMVVFMTYEISRSMAVTGAWLTAIIIGAAATAVGIEVVGILSGHALETSWRVGDQWRALLAFVLLLIYTVGAVYILRRNDTIMPAPIIAAIVYVVAALVDGLEQHKAHEETAVSQREAFDLSEEAKDREAARKLKAENDQRQHEENLRKLELDLEEKKLQADERRRKREERQEKARRKQAQETFDHLATEEKILAIYSKEPKASQQTVADQVDVSRQRVGQILQDLESNGVISRNGKGVVIL